MTDRFTGVFLIIYSLCLVSYANLGKSNPGVNPCLTLTSQGQPLSPLIMIVLRSKHPEQSWEVEYVEYPSGVLGKHIPILERHGGTAILTTPGCLHLEMSCDTGWQDSS